MKNNLIIAIILLVTLNVNSIFAQSSKNQLARARQLQQSGVLLEAISEYEDYLSKNAADTDARMELVQILLKLNNIDKAITHIDDLAWRKPDDPQVKQFQDTVKQYREKKVLQGIDQYEERVSRPDASPDEILEYARYLAANRNYQRSADMFNRYLTKKPNDNIARLELARQYAWNRQYKNCSNQIDILVQRNPSNAEAWMLLADILYWQDKKEEALESYQRVIKLDPNNAKATAKIREITNSPGFEEKRLKNAVAKNPNGPPLVDLARYYVNQKRVFEADDLIKHRLEIEPNDKKAQALAEVIAKLLQEYHNELIQSYRNRIALNSKDTTALLELARFYSSQNDFERAIEYYTTYLELYPNDYRIRLQRAYIYNWVGMILEAIAEFRTISYIDAYKRDADLGLGEALLLADENYAEAETIFKRDLVDYPNSLRSKIGYAEALRRQGRYDEAQVMYDDILKQDPENKDAKEGIALLSKDFAPLIRHLEKELEKDKNDEIIRRRLAALYYANSRYFESEEQVLFLLDLNPEDKRMTDLLAKIAEKKKLYIKSEIAQTRLKVQDNPTDDELRLRYADLLAADNQQAEAVMQYRTVLENRKGDKKIQIRLAKMYSSNQDWDQAIAIYSRLADENPNEFEFRFQLGQAYLWMGKYEKALPEFRLALLLQPESIETLLAIANVYRWSGDIYSAYDAYDVVVRKDPQNQYARRALREMSGAFFRGLQIQHFSSYDNENFKLSETKLGISANYSLRLQAHAGYGYISVEQTDSTDRYPVSTKGNFLFAKIDYSFDRFTRLRAEYHYNIFSSRTTDAYFIELERDFSETPELEGTTGILYYTSQDAIMEVASTSGLQTWTDQLRTDKLGARVTHDPENRWIFEGNLQIIFISDGNTRTDGWISGGYELNSYLNAGLRYDFVQTKLDLPEYWTPSTYGTIMGYAKLHRSTARFNYSLFGGIGRVRITNDTIKQFYAQAGYKLSQRFNLGAGYSALQTSRADGEYTYNRWALSLAWSK